MNKTINLEQLWHEFKTKHNIDARNEILLHYTPLVKNIVYRMIPTYRRHVDMDDLTSYGIIGLIDAIDKFDLTKEVKFETYASLRIKGEIVDQIRKQDWAPISLRQKIKKVEEAYASVESELGRGGTDAEVAAKLSMSVDEVNKVMEEAHTFNMLCLDELVSDRVKSEEYLQSDEFSPEERVENEELKEMLAEFIDDLPEKEKLVISMYYYNEMTLKEIGLVLGVSESRVSQIHSKTLMTLRNRMSAANA